MFHYQISCWHPDYDIHALLNFMHCFSLNTRKSSKLKHVLTCQKFSIFWQKCWDSTAPPSCTLSTLTSSLDGCCWYVHTSSCGSWLLVDEVVHNICTNTVWQHKKINSSIYCVHAGYAMCDRTHGYGYEFQPLPQTRY